MKASAAWAIWAGAELRRDNPDSVFTPQQLRWLDAMTPYLSKLNPQLGTAIASYVLTGRPLRGFPRAVLANDWGGVARYADDEHGRDLIHLLALLHFATPPSCFGSDDKVGCWIRHRGLLYSLVDA